MSAEEHLLRLKRCRDRVRSYEGRQVSPSALRHLEAVIRDVLDLAEEEARREERRRVDHFHVRRALRRKILE